MMKYVLVIFVAMFSLSQQVKGNEIFDAWGESIVSTLVDAGVDGREARRSFAKITTLGPLETGPGSWVYELANPGMVHFRTAQGLELKGKNTSALRSYRRAMTYLSAARFPATYTTEREVAYKQQLNAYRKVAVLSGFPLELIDIPFQGKTIKVHFHSRNKLLGLSGEQPVLIWSGGLDGWKTSDIAFKRRLMEEGFSILAIDLPGTGESEWTLGASSNEIYDKVVDYLMARNDVNEEKIAVYFGSFSGVFAIKMALTNPNIAAAVNHSGGIHLFFHPPIDAIPPLTTTMGMRATATTYAMDVFDSDMDAIKVRLATMSLKDQGLLKATPDQAPLLSIYGTADRLMPIQDLDVLMESGVMSTNLVYDGDRHMAWEHKADHQKKMIDWLKSQLDI